MVTCVIANATFLLTGPSTNFPFVPTLEMLSHFPDSALLVVAIAAMCLVSYFFRCRRW